MQRETNFFLTWSIKMAKKQTQTQTEEAPAESPKKSSLASIKRLPDDTFEVIFQDGASLHIVPEELPENIKAELMFLGLTNKIRDSWASAKGDVEFAKGAANKTLDNLKNGLWVASRASGPAARKTTELVQAIANLKNRTVEEVQAIVDNATDESIAAWRKNAQVKAEILRIRHEAARARLEKSQETNAFEL